LLGAALQSQEIAARRQVTDREPLDQELLLLVDERFERHRFKAPSGDEQARRVSQRRSGSHQAAERSRG
jgi:hypothetical protein